MDQKANNTKGFVLTAVTINSERNIVPVDITGIVSDIQFFEHLDKPYITGNIVISDSVRLYDRLDIQGAEEVIIEMQMNLDSPKVRRKFYITKIAAAQKTNETTEMIALTIVDDWFFRSTVKNVNKVFTGSPDSIIEQIAEQYLDLEVVREGSFVFQNEMKVIVPNLTPLQAIMWIKQRATTDDGMPFYVYNDFITNRLNISDVVTLTSQVPYNRRKPFLYGVTDSLVIDEKQYAYLPIKAYKIKDVQSMLSLVDKGLVSSTHSFFHTSHNKIRNHSFNIQKDIFDRVELDRSKHYKFSEDFKIDDENITKLGSRKISRISSSGPFEIGATANYKSYSEETDPSDHVRKITSRAMRHFLIKDPISIRVDGKAFIRGDYNMTIGNCVRLLFLANRPNTTEGGTKLDMLKSGDYVVYSSKHTFSLTRYDVDLECVKISDFTNEGSMLT
ncbi:hypothetical protein OAA37_00635 [bacterium]|jgi:hypothetical protein|nr:hypothetical protein [bacterium]MDB4347960.1 hypothetical protein [bacterium]